jgi:myosin protein heavy chain
LNLPLSRYLYLLAILRQSSLKIMGISESEQMNLWKTIAAILHLGNIIVASDRSDQARIPDLAQAELACHILGIPSDGFLKALLTPRVRAGREWVNQSRTKAQVLHSLDALAKTLYEKSFGYLVERINQSMERNSIKTSFIGVLDIAGFEIFQVI